MAVVSCIVEDQREHIPPSSVSVELPCVLEHFRKVSISNSPMSRLNDIAPANTYIHNRANKRQKQQRKEEY